MAFKLDPPNAPTTSVPALASWCVRQFGRIAALWESDVEAIRFRVLETPPASVRKGMVVMAGATLGAHPDFASGEGLYRRNEANNAWVHLG